MKNVEDVLEDCKVILDAGVPDKTRKFVTLYVKPLFNVIKEPAVTALSVATLNPVEPVNVVVPSVNDVADSNEFIPIVCDKVTLLKLIPEV